MPIQDHKAVVSMLIRRPIHEVYQAFINPDVTTKFWFTHSTGLLEEGKVVEWKWEMYNINIPVTTQKLVPNNEILIQWGDNPNATAHWQFTTYQSNFTYVVITSKGFEGNTKELIAQVSDSSGGFNLVLAGLKAYLEHGIQLNLVGDKSPEGI